MTWLIVGAGAQGRLTLELLRAVDAAATLWEPAGLWTGPAPPVLYPWRPIWKISGALLALAILALAAPGAAAVQRFHHRIDAVVMHPVWGLALLAAILFLMFQAVFSWANVPMDANSGVLTVPLRLCATSSPRVMRHTPNGRSSLRQSFVIFM